MHQQVVDHHPGVAEPFGELVGEHHPVHAAERVVGDEQVASGGVQLVEPDGRVGDLPFAEAGADEFLGRQVPVGGQNVVDFPFADGAAEPVDCELRNPAGQPGRFLPEYAGDVYLWHVLNEVKSERLKADRSARTQSGVSYGAAKIENIIAKYKYSFLEIV